jgi:hypothetical protein
LTKPVYAFSVAWHPEQKPDPAHMLATARSAAAALGLAEHQAIYVCHNDEPQPHVHVLVNRVHPETGRAATLGNDAKKLQAWALAYQKQHGETYCPAREANARRRALPAAERVPVERNPAIASAWRRSDSGRGFQAALKAEGFTLAQGNRRLVVIDRYGKAVNPVRELPGVKAAAFKARLLDLDLTALPSAEAAQRAARAAERQKYHAARDHDRWAAEYLNKNQDRQIAERAALSDRYTKELAERRDALAKQYKTGELQAAVERLRERTERAGLLRRVTGGAAKDRAELDATQRQLADVQQRTAEQLGSITSAWDRETANLAARHERQNELARDVVAERRPTQYAEERVPEAARGGSTAGHDRDDEGGRERVHYRTWLVPRPLV